MATGRHVSPAGVVHRHSTEADYQGCVRYMSAVQVAILTVSAQERFGPFTPADQGYASRLVEGRCPE